MYNPASCQPDYPAALASLQHMDIDGLKEILNDEDKFDTFVKELPQIKSLDAEKEMLMTSNKSLAEYNISQEPVVKERKEKLLEKFQTATQLADKVKALKADIDNKSGKMTPDSLLILLEAANQEAEEESETMVEFFMADGGSLEEFLENYKEKRKLAHLRRIKIDKMRELISNKQNTPSRPAPPPPSNTSASQLPYPTNSAGTGFPGYPPIPTPGYAAPYGHPQRYPPGGQYYAPAPPGYRQPNHYR